MTPYSPQKKLLSIFLLSLAFSWPWLIVLSDRQAKNQAISALWQLEEDQTILLYFGYLGCGSACPQALSILSDFLNQNPDEAIATYFIPIEVSSVQTQPSTLNNYASSFHPKLKTISIHPIELDSIRKNFKLFFHQGVGTNEWIHTNKVHLVQIQNESWILINSFPLNKPLSLNEIQEAITNWKGTL